MPCPPQVPISIIPPVSQGQSPILWQNGNQITRLNKPLNPSWLVYDGTTTRWGDGSAQAPVYLPNLQQYPVQSINYYVGLTTSGQLAATTAVATSTTANIGGGAAGEVVYQIATNQTGFTAQGTTGQLLKSNGTSAPTWTTDISNNTALATGSTTARTLANRFTDYVSVHDFGAVGNGVTDDTAAIQAALNYVSSTYLGGVVTIEPTKRYLIDSANLIIPTRCGIVGQTPSVGVTQASPSGGVYTDYSAIPNCIVLNPSYTILLNTSSFVKGFSIARKGITISCNVDNPSLGVRPALDNVKAFAGTALTANYSDITIQDMFIIGFNLAILGADLNTNPNYNVARLSVYNVKADNNGFCKINACGDIARIENIHSWPYISASIAGDQSLYTWTVGSVTNNGSGLVRITTTASNPLVTGDIVNLSTQLSTSGNYPLCKRWTITVINSTTFDLQGSSYSTISANLPGTTVTAFATQIWWRPNPCYYILGNSNVDFVECFGYGYNIGFYYADNSNGSPSFCSNISCGLDNLLNARDPNVVGISIGSGITQNQGTAMIRFDSCFVLSYALNFIGNCLRTDVPSAVLANCSFAQAEPQDVSNLVNLKSGYYLFSTSDFGNGLISIDNSKTSGNFNCSAKFSSCLFVLGQQNQFVYPSGAGTGLTGSNTWIDGIRQDGNITITGDITSTYGTAQINLNAINKNGIGQYNCNATTITLVTDGETTAWSANQNYSYGQLISSGGNYYKITTAGTSGTVAFSGTSTTPVTPTGGTCQYAYTATTLYNAGQFRVNGSGVGSIVVGPSSTAYNTSSDYRLKTNVTPITGALDRISAITAHRFNWKNNPNGTPVDGFLAHEVAEIVPEAITGFKDAVDENGNPIYQAIDQSKLVPILFAAIQELKAQVETLTHKSF